MSKHGELRGLDRVASSPQFEGRFGRMFRTLPPAQFAEADLRKLAAAMVAKLDDPQTPETEPDGEENSGISAGYTYLGQFIDHDLTLDTTSSLEKQNDPDALIDFRTPRFDLDCVYGRGPDDQPYLYAPDGLRLLLGRKLTGNADDPNAQDLQRNRHGRALIGDPRNDENVIVSQLQSSFIRFHNRMVDFTRSKDFGEVQCLVRRHYQWVVLHDFLPTIVGPEVVHDILPQLANPGFLTPHFHAYHPRGPYPFMPVEFSVAAYRFGHSMVRPIYRLNQTIQRILIFSTDPSNSLVGFHEFPDYMGIDWSLFFKMGPAPEFGPKRVQPAYKVDSSLVNPLGQLPPAVATGVVSLAERNLLRGLRMGLPSGQAVARRLGLPVIPDEMLRVGKATHEDADKNPRLVDLAPGFADNAPLWYYVLAEAQQPYQTTPPPDDTLPVRLGPVGGRIVAEVFIGLMLGDHHSYLHLDPAWRPFPEFEKEGRFGMAELIAQALQASPVP